MNSFMTWTHKPGQRAETQWSPLSVYRDFVGENPSPKEILQGMCHVNIRLGKDCYSYGCKYNYHFFPG